MASSTKRFYRLGGRCRHTQIGRPDWRISEHRWQTEFEGVRLLAVVHYPYLVYYTIDEDEVVIIHIRHGARDKPDPGDF